MLKLTWTVPSSSFSPLSVKHRVPASHVTTISHKGQSTANQMRFLLSLTNRSNSKMNKFVRNSIDPSGALGRVPRNSWQRWIFKLVVSLILPFSTDEVDRILDRVEIVAKVVEQVAKRVEEIADEIGDNLPENEKLKRAFDLIEKVAEEIAKDAHLVDTVIEKVEQVDDKEESISEQILEDQPQGKRENVDQINDKETT